MLFRYSLLYSALPHVFVVMFLTRARKGKSKKLVIGVFFLSFSVSQRHSLLFQLFHPLASTKCGSRVYHTVLCCPFLCLY